MGDSEPRTLSPAGDIPSCGLETAYMPWGDALRILGGHQQMFYSQTAPPAPAWLGSFPWVSGACVQEPVTAGCVLILR